MKIMPEIVISGLLTRGGGGGDGGQSAPFCTNYNVQGY